MIKKLLLCTVVLSASTAVAFAADLPSRRAPPVYVPPPVAPVFTWTGFYVGANAGYAFNNKSFIGTTGNTAGAAATLASGARPGFAANSDSGFTGGLQIGYNYELGNSFGGLPALGTFGGLGGGGLVVGVEADAAYTDLRNASIYGAGATTSAFATRTDYVGTARGRLGIAIGNALVYGTGGFAYGGVRNSATFTGIGAGTGGSDSIRTGYAYGGGIEYAIPTTSFVNVFHAGAVTLKAEYLHYDLGSQIVSAGAYTSRIKTEGNLVRGGINYKFDTFGGATPVVARY